MGLLSLGTTQRRLLLLYVLLFLLHADLFSHHKHCLSFRELVVVAVDKTDVEAILQEAGQQGEYKTIGVMTLTQN